MTLESHRWKEVTQAGFGVAGERRKVSKISMDSMGTP